MRLLVHVEGQTEEQFVNEILSPHLCRRGYTLVFPQLLGKGSGICSWALARRDISRGLDEDWGRISTTFVDYYGLPAEGGRAWPGRAEASRLAIDARAGHVESAILRDLTNGDPRRFVPYVSMHEFEAMLFSDCAAFARAIERPHLAPQFQAIRDGFQTPEEINDSVENAPSKRIKRIVDRYEKPLFGAIASLEIGLERIRAECRHFDEWLARLEG
jgi:hypothetical protein